MCVYHTGGLICKWIVLSFADQRFVEITVVLHGYHDLESNNISSLTDLYSQLAESPDKFFVCNYR